MSVKLEGVHVEVDMVRLDSESIDDHLRSTAAVLCEIMHGDSGTEGCQGEYARSEADADDRHACERCGKLYKSASTLSTHVRLKHPEDESDVRCNVCHKGYASSLSLQKHVRYMHQYEHRCQACYRRFPSLQTLEQHSKFCVKTESPCPNCGKIFDTHLSLRNHIKYKHPKEQTHMCCMCRRTFRSSRGLSNHMGSIHPAGVNCSQCNKPFNSVAVLQNHYLNKHAENGARCNLCRKVFASRGNLSRHLSKLHGIAIAFNDDKYWCGLCNVAFLCTNYAIQHVMTMHTNVQKD